MTQNPRTIACFAAAVVLHIVGALFAWTTHWTAASVPEPDTQVTLAGTTIGRPVIDHFPQEPPQVGQPELSPLDPRILITPKAAYVADRTYFQTSTDVSRPSPAELAMVDRLLSTPARSAPRRNALSLPETLPPTAAPAKRPTAFASRSVPRPPVRSTVPQASRPSVGDGVASMPKLVSNRPPGYPSQAIRSRWEGTTLLRVHIDRTGKVTRVELIASSGHGVLDAAAGQAVRSWRFEPAQRNGQAVATVVRLPVRFALDAEKYIQEIQP